MKNEVIKSNLQLSKLKHKAIELRVNYQLPYYLVYLIRNLDIDTDVNIIRKMQFYSEHFLRIKGYYKKYPIEDEKSGCILKEMFAIKDDKIIDLTVDRKEGI